MDYKVWIYAITLLSSVFALTGINFINFFKKEKKAEAKLFIILASMALGYLAGAFIIEFLEVSKIF